MYCIYACIVPTFFIKNWGWNRGRVIFRTQGWLVFRNNLCVTYGFVVFSWEAFSFIQRWMILGSKLFFLLAAFLPFSSVGPIMHHFWFKFCRIACSFLTHGCLSLLKSAIGCTQLDNSHKSLDQKEIWVGITLAPNISSRSCGRALKYH